MWSPHVTKKKYNYKNTLFLFKEKCCTHIHKLFETKQRKKNVGGEKIRTSCQLGYFDNKLAFKAERQKSTVIEDLDTYFFF